MPPGIRQAIADTDHLVELLNKLWGNADLRNEYARKGREFAETMTWDGCVERWMILIGEMRAGGAATSTGTERMEPIVSPTVSAVVAIKDHMHP